MEINGEDLVQALNHIDTDIKLYQEEAEKTKSKYKSKLKTLAEHYKNYRKSVKK